MNKYERFKRKIALRERVIGTNLTLINSPPLLELMNEEYLDYVVIDMEHGIFNNENIIPLLQTARLIGLPAFVRVPAASDHHITRCMDFGADGIMIPRVETLRQVELAIDNMFLPPIGKKGRGGYCQLRAGETIKDYQKNRHLLLQIESPTGIENLPAMLDRYGEQIAAVVVGPYDLSISLGVPEQFEHPDLHAAIRNIFDICVARGKSVGIFCDNAEQAKCWEAQGANFMWMCTDERLFLSALRSAISPLIL